MSGRVVEDAGEYMHQAEIDILDNYILPGGAAWTMFAPTKKGTIPVGLVFGLPVIFGPHPVMMLGDMQWFKWASDRNRVEAFVHFVNIIRREHRLMWASEYRYKRYYEHIAKHGIIRRIGTWIDDPKLTIWQGR